YDSKCARCHGEKAEKSSYANARILTKLSKNEIVESVKDYRRNLSDIQSTTAFIMRAEAVGVNDNQVKDVAAYIETLKNHK
ncbi:MAG: c-type cytochrome, partial [Campylobacteraceae bacterium]|nr:c-type cytochrome [Campylobacteraceae bacterium]